ncbi:type III polyketide synthase [Acidicapsa ligni]|uniref:type III polyketide synthase n=1 Tax=Acidicapsa ligni TaxID=542300 RepID=UPI0021E0F074|nr:type III polyketide synthase [Acidicapsa ligni]
MMPVCISRIATATPPHDVHAGFLDYASSMLLDQRKRALLNHMAKRSGIDHRYSFVKAERNNTQGTFNGEAFYHEGSFPATAKRMEIFETFSPQLLHSALDRLALNEEERQSIRHVIVTCCTGLFAPGLDFAAIDYLQLDPGTDRTMVGFMGCYAAINGLKLARHIVRSEPTASVLMINLELCSLHFQKTQELEKILAFLLFGDGCAVSLIRASDQGFALDNFRAYTIPEARDLIRWRVGDSGFDMDLSGKVPGEIRKTLSLKVDEINPEKNIDLWAVHPGGRSILDAVESSMELAPDTLAASRSILRRFGNMSSATVMFVLEELMRTAQSGQRGCAMSFGPGLTAETMNFHVL